MPECPARPWKYPPPRRDPIRQPDPALAESARPCRSKAPGRDRPVAPALVQRSSVARSISCAAAFSAILCSRSSDCVARDIIRSSRSSRVFRIFHLTREKINRALANASVESLPWNVHLIQKLDAKIDSSTLVHKIRSPMWRKRTSSNHIEQVPRAIRLLQINLIDRLNIAPAMVASRPCSAADSANKFLRESMASSP